MAKVVLPTTDLMFKKILASNDHKTITQGFIADFFGVDVELNDIRIVNPYSISAYPHMGGGRRLRETLRDVTLEVRNTNVAVEMQLRAHETFPKRGLFYWADLFTGGYGRGAKRRRQEPDDDYFANLRPTWAMNILGQPLLKCPHAYHMFTLHDAHWDEEMLPELIRFGFYELTKPDTNAEDFPRLARWRGFLRSGQADTADPEYLQEAASIIEYVNLSSEERSMIDAAEKWELDQRADRYYAKKEAREEGLAEGRAEGRAEGSRQNQLANARAALRLGLNRADVAEITGLDAATVKQLADDLAPAS